MYSKTSWSRAIHSYRVSGQGGGRRPTSWQKVTLTSPLEQFTLSDCNWAWLLKQTLCVARNASNKKTPRDFSENQRRCSSRRCKAYVHDVVKVAIAPADSSLRCTACATDLPARRSLKNTVDAPLVVGTLVGCVLCKRPLLLVSAHYIALLAIETFNAKSLHTGNRRGLNAYVCIALPQLNNVRGTAVARTRAYAPNVV